MGGCKEGLLVWGGGGSREELPSVPLRGGGETPRPPPPMAISATVHCIGTSRRKNGVPSIPGLPLVLSGNPSPESLWARLPTGYPLALPSPLGAGEEAEGRAGWGLRVPLPGETGEGARPYALTFGMETREDTVQFRRRTSLWGNLGRSAVNRPPPRKTVLIPVGGQSVRARPVRSGRLSSPDRVFPGYRHTLPPPPRAIPTTVHRMG